MSNNKTLRQAFREHLSGDALSAAEFDALKKLEKKQNTVKRFATPALAASLCCIILSAAFWWSNPGVNEQQFRARIVNEVLTNHFAIKPLDLKSQSLQHIAGHFKRLDFVPYLSSQLNQKLNPMGGRYCTLQGNIALQVRLTDAAGDSVTYYQARYQSEHYGPLPDADHNEAPYVVLQRGIEISMWQEKGTINVLASPASH